MKSIGIDLGTTSISVNVVSFPGPVSYTHLHLYRPFVAKYLLDVLPETVKKISVLDRTKEPGSIGEPLYLDVLAAINGTQFATCPVYTGRYGLGSKDTKPSDIIAVYRNMAVSYTHLLWYT